MELHTYTGPHDWSVGTGAVVVVVAVAAVAAVTVAVAGHIAAAGHVAAVGHHVKKSSCVLRGESSTGTVVHARGRDKRTREKTRRCLSLR